MRDPITYAIALQMWLTWTVLWGLAVWATCAIHAYLKEGLHDSQDTRTFVTWGLMAAPFLGLYMTCTGIIFS